ncbi:hypothetical protein CUMW_115400 [Citrus unshiu]|nr:hypothetical protein CUMW_115400 [Citrus unshiu]
MATVGSNEVESGRKCRLKKLCVGAALGLFDGMDDNDMEPSPSVEIVTMACGVTSHGQGFCDLCAVWFWDVRGCGMVLRWLKGDVDSKAAVNGVGRRCEEGTPALAKHHHHPPMEP